MGLQCQCNTDSMIRKVKNNSGTSEKALLRAQSQEPFNHQSGSDHIRRLINRKEAAKILGFACTESIKRLERRGLLPAIKISNRATRYEISSVEGLIASSKVGGQS